MVSHSNSPEIPFGATKLCQDIATLFNNRQGSDVQFKVGGGIRTQENGDTVCDKPETITLYAHSLILRCRSRYFAAMFDEENNWKESLKGVIYKPNISPSTFQDVLHYIYAGSLPTKTPENILELIAAADEMDLEELSAECQSEFVRTIKYILSDESEESTKQCISIDVAINTHIIPALNLANNHSLTYLSQRLLTVILPHMSTIIKSPDVYSSFISGISSEALIKIIASDDLALTERNVWDLALSWSCHQVKLSKTAVEARLSLDDDDEKDGDELSDGKAVSDTQLNQLKTILIPLLPGIRFSLFDSEDYKRMSDVFYYFLSRHQFLKLNRFFLNSDNTKLLDVPRKNIIKIFSKIVVKSTAWELLKESIFETGGIAGCHSLNDLKFELLFRASEHGFLASTFHQRCDNKGPTLVIIRSVDGYLFGGVNFNHWTSSQGDTFSISTLNFLFSLPDNRHREDSTIFKIKETHAKYSSCNNSKCGPAFGGGGRCDLAVQDSADTNKDSFSNLPNCYNGNGASNIALAGSPCFTVSDYEVFAIFK